MSSWNRTKRIDWRKFKPFKITAKNSKNTKILLTKAWLLAHRLRQMSQSSVKSSKSFKRGILHKSKQQKLSYKQFNLRNHRFTTEIRALSKRGFLQEGNRPNQAPLSDEPGLKRRMKLLREASESWIEALASKLKTYLLVKERIERYSSPLKITLTGKGAWLAWDKLKKDEKASPVRSRKKFSDLDPEKYPQIYHLIKINLWIQASRELQLKVEQQPHLMR